MIDTTDETDPDEEISAVLRKCGTDVSDCDLCPSPVLNQRDETSVNISTSESVTTLSAPYKDLTAISGINDNVESSYTCHQCKKLLPDDGILADNSNASVGCDCPNCGGCDIWYCWPCAKFTQEWVDENIDWFYPECTRECDIVY